MRRNKFQDIPNLDLELDSIVSSVLELTGKKATDLPLKSQTPEMARFIKKLSDGSYVEYIKVDGEFRLLGGGGSGGSAYIAMRVSGGYIQWRDDPAGAWVNLIATNDLKGEPGEPGEPGPPGTVSDGDKGDITVSDSGATFTINNAKVTESKIANDAVVEAKIKNNEVTEAKLKLADNTTGNVSTARHGLMPKLPNDAGMFLNGVGNWIDLTVIITFSQLTALAFARGFEVLEFASGNGVLIS